LAFDPALNRYTVETIKMPRTTIMIASFTEKDLIHHALLRCPRSASGAADAFLLTFSTLFLYLFKE